MKKSIITLLFLALAPLSVFGATASTAVAPEMKKAKVVKVKKTCGKKHAGPAGKPKLVLKQRVKKKGEGKLTARVKRAPKQSTLAVQRRVGNNWSAVKTAYLWDGGAKKITLKKPKVNRYRAVLITTKGQCATRGI